MVDRRNALPGEHDRRAGAEFADVARNSGYPHIRQLGRQGFVGLFSAVRTAERTGAGPVSASRCSSSPWPVAPGRFSRRVTNLAAATGATTVAPVLGGHRLVRDLVVLRYQQGPARSFSKCGASVLELVGMVAVTKSFVDIAPSTVPIPRNGLRARAEAAPTWHKHGLRRSVAGWRVQSVVATPF